ncbi:MAG: COX15/CtaA family protein [SAR324 cluster bacterium]|nr:COX15/CtaA family protein [SAR324 cluster bacterium]
MKLSSYGKFAWGNVFYNLLVVVWGAYVRATGSGAGCGRHWPVCNGEIIPPDPSFTTMVEYSHRLTSGLALIGALMLYMIARKLWEKGQIVRKAAGWTLFFMLTEATLGAGLVLLELVADDVSVLRIISMPAHLVNTFLLIGTMALTAWWASWGAPTRLKRENWTKMHAAVLFLLLVGISGAITALGDTLFPVDAFGDRDPSTLAAQFLIKMRIVHPAMAVTIGGVIAYMALQYTQIIYQPLTRTLARILMTVIMFQVGVGAFNIILRVPVWLQMFHLFTADVVWISLVLLTAQVMAVESDTEG